MRMILSSERQENKENHRFVKMFLVVSVSFNTLQSEFSFNRTKLDV